jgi:hypothetical protein
LKDCRAGIGLWDRGEWMAKHGYSTYKRPQQPCWPMRYHHCRLEIRS